jgi:hypothetical protein
MNLWVRTLRQLAVLAVALFFFSCEDEASLLGFKNPNKKFHVGYVDIPLNVSSIVSLDSLVTDLRPVFSEADGQSHTVDGLLVGQYQDPVLGNVTAQSFLTLYPTINNALQTGAVYDSVTVQFRLSFHGYGFSGSQQKTVKIHEITGDTLTLFNGNTYYATSPAPQYSVDPLGQAVVSVNYDSLKKQAALVSTQQDTLLATGRLSDQFGSRLFEATRAGFTTAALHRIFKAQIKGLALLPGDEPGVLGINGVSASGQLSRVILHYHTVDAAGAVDDTLSRGFGTEFASFTRIEADRSASELAGISSYQAVEPGSGYRYIQSGAPLVAKLDLSQFYNFADTVDNIVVNSAEFLIENVAASAGLHPHTALSFRLMKNDSDQFLNIDVAADRPLALNYYVIPGGQITTFVPYGQDYFNAAADLTTEPVASIAYDEEKNHFSGFLTKFVQSLFSNKGGLEGNRETRLKYLGIYPVSPQFSRSVTRTVFHKEDVRLRIYYTRANPVTP